MAMCRSRSWLSRFVGPIPDRVGAEPWLAPWVSQIVVGYALTLAVFASVKMAAILGLRRLS